MNNNPTKTLPSFLFEEDDKFYKDSLINLNLILNGLASDKKPYQINYNTLLMSYSLWQGTNLDEFCYKQALSYFLFNPKK